MGARNDNKIVDKYYDFIESQTPSKKEAMLSALAMIDVKARRARLEELEGLVSDLTGVIIDTSRKRDEAVNKLNTALRGLGLLGIINAVLLIAVLVKV